jgi:NADH-quinone oxidoreductase subunit G
MITITINNIPCQAQEGEFVLNVARRNHIFIPALCYLTGCSPTLACRLCLVDIDGKRAYACNAKAKADMNVITSTQEIEAERKAIMQVYDINHPLECGVCDQSGECELQNYTLQMGVEHQAYAIQDTHRPAKTWGKIHYDPSLCIVCERCVTVCKDKIGESALKTVPREGEALPKEWKENMPKDAFAMWNKLQKSLIGPTSGETLTCTECGECTAVCPVGALVGTDFQYRANAWELRKIPASNPHSSDCALLYYDVKQGGIDAPKEEIYRVSSEIHFSTLHGAARYGYDIENRVDKKDETTFKRVVEALQSGEAKTVRFNSFITNEEALILQTLKEKLGLKLLNPEAKRYQQFLQGFQATSGQSLYSATMERIAQSDFLISVGTALKTDAPSLGYAFNNALTMNKGAGLYFHPVKDPVVEGYAKNLLSVVHKAGREEAALLWVLSQFGENLPEALATYLATFKRTVSKEVKEVVKETQTEMVKDEETGEEKPVEKTVSKTITKTIEVEENTLWETLGVENMDESIQKLLAKKERFSLIAGEDLITHPRASNLSNLLGLIERFTPFEVLIVPPRTNSLGVALVCELDEEAEGKCVGYNEAGELTLSALGKGDLDMPSLTQQEGTFVNFDGRVVPTNAALPYKGYCLNDVANALECSRPLTIDYTSLLPQGKGFCARSFDSLPNRFDNDGTEQRGYKLERVGREAQDAFEPMQSIDMGETFVYQANPVHQFSPFTNRAHQLNEAGALYASPEFLTTHGFKDGQMVKIINDEGDILVIAVKEETLIGGMIPYLPTFDLKIDTAPFFTPYRFAKVAFEGVSHE